MKLKPLHGRVTVKVLSKQAKIGAWDTKEELNLKKMDGRLACGEVVTVGFEDAFYFTSDEGLSFTRKETLVVRPGDKILFYAVPYGSDVCQRVLYEGEIFCTIPQSAIYAVIEED